MMEGASTVDDREVEQFRSLLAEADPADIIEAPDQDDEA